MSLTLSTNHKVFKIPLLFDDANCEAVQLSEAQQSSIVTLQEIFPSVSKERILRIFREKEFDISAAGQALLEKQEEGFSSDEEQSSADFSEEESECNIGKGKHERDDGTYLY